MNERKYLVQLPYEIQIDFEGHTRPETVEVSFDTQEEAINFFKEIISNNLIYQVNSQEIKIAGYVKIIERIIDISTYTINDSVKHSVYCCNGRLGVRNGYTFAFEPLPVQPLIDNFNQTVKILNDTISQESPTLTNSELMKKYCSIFRKLISQYEEYETYLREKAIVEKKKWW